MLTIDDLKTLEVNDTIATGTCINSPEDIYMTDSNIGSQMRWVAVKGFNNDWCIYIHWEYYSIHYVKRSGDKVRGNENIKKLVPCTDQVMQHYRS